MRVIVIKSNDKELNEAFMELAELFSQGFRIEGKEELQESNKEGEYVSLHAYEELERQLDKAIEERNKLEELNRKLLIIFRPIKRPPLAARTPQSNGA